MEDELREAVFAAAKRDDVNRAVAGVYAALATAVDLRRPICKTSGRCCRFEEFGHRLYVTTLELAKFVADAGTTPDIPLRPDETANIRSLPVLSERQSATDGGCRFQLDGLCGVHGIRPFGCRIFFCDETSTQWQHEVYEQLHGQLRALHEQLNVPYFYVEWRFALQVCL